MGQWLQFVSKIRICIDPVNLNKLIKREHYAMHTVEEFVTDTVVKVVAGAVAILKDILIVAVDVKTSDLKSWIKLLRETCAHIHQHNDPMEPVEFFCDASSRGAGAVLLQYSRPVGFFSRFITNAELCLNTSCEGSALCCPCMQQVSLLHLWRAGHSLQ